MMNSEYYKEKVKFLTEWLRGLLAVTVLIASGVLSLILRNNFIMNTIEKLISITGTILFFGFLSLIILINKNINHNINQLKND